MSRTGRGRTGAWEACSVRASGHKPRNQVLTGMMVEAHISKPRYRHVIASIKLLTAAAPLGFAYVAAPGIAT